MFFLPLMLGLILIFIFISFSKKTGLFVDVAEGDELKIHKGKKSLLGGLALFLSISLSLIFFELPIWGNKILAIFYSFSIVFLLGFYDDVKWKHASKSNPLLKFAFLIVCTLHTFFISDSGAIFGVF